MIFRRPFYSSSEIISKSGDDSGVTQEDLEEEDFLLAEVKVKSLNHERDYFRQETRMQAWDSYVLVSVLCTSISYNALQSFRLDPIHQGVYIYETVVESLIRLTAGLSVVCGIYATMVFTLGILYGKTALGMERDAQYDDFLEQTLDVRRKAFMSFSFALGFFSLLSVVVVSEKLPLVLHLPVGAFLIGALIVGYQDWKILVDSAAPIYRDD
ncbi:expressed unknown protein [Seminavis robusta]|uniref:Uncharacterized protein n=1 Tax=Seminavis robusta TaxID=568900 RepID=A0A9N8DGR6_9STRA|nr:expressed unknown protein [Seminavis robusta]|eukprot:Sro82_g043960.1 n/a (212) ;mRNA; r:85587-86222